MSCCENLFYLLFSILFDPTLHGFVVLGFYKIKRKHLELSTSLLHCIYFSELVFDIADKKMKGMMFQCKLRREL